MAHRHPSPQAHVLASTASTRCEREAQKYAASSKPVLLLGETGTGKSYWAKRIHDISPLAKGPFIPINLAGTVETLASSTLFGCVKGAHSTAYRDVSGAFEAAGGGTVFLDEIGDADMSVQRQFLQVLTDGTYSRVGEPAVIRSSNARVICATNRNLKAAVRAGTFREDLYYRLCVLPMTLLPLRERREELVPLACAFIQKELPTVSPDLVAALAMQLIARFGPYSWPGNARELEHAVAIAALELSCGADSTEAMDEAYRKVCESRLDLGDPSDQPLRSLCEQQMRSWVSGKPGLTEFIGQECAPRIADALRNLVASGTFMISATPTALGKLLGIPTLADGKIKSQLLNLDNPAVQALVLLAHDAAFPLPVGVREALRRATAANSESAVGEVSI